VTVSPVEGTQLIEVSVQDGSSYRAANIANEIVNVFRVEARAYQSTGYELLVVDPALPSSTPVSPRVWLNVLICVALWGFLVIGWSVVRTQFSVTKPSSVARVGEAAEDTKLRTIVQVAVSSACNKCVYRVMAQAQQIDGKTSRPSSGATVREASPIGARRSS